MKLLGTYKSNLSAFHYQELLSLLKEAIRAGELSGSKSFSDDQVLALVQQAEDFAGLPLPSAGQRVTDDSFNTPLNLLEARFTALVNESDDFVSRSKALISVLEKDTLLLDQILAAISLEDWITNQPTLYGAKKIYWDYGMGAGRVTKEITSVDPVNGVLYTADGNIETNFDTTDGSITDGITYNHTDKEVAVKNLTWSYQTSGQKEELYGDDWTKLSLLEDRPLLTFAASPDLDVLLPSKGSALGIFDVAGISLGGSLPTYVRTFFHPRKNSTVLTPTNAISSLPDRFAISAGQQVYVSISANNIGADGSLQLALSCQKADNTELKRLLLVPVTQTQTVSGLITIPNDPAISKGQLVVVLANHTVGSWTQTDVVVHLPQQLTPYDVEPDSVVVYTTDDESDLAQIVYFANQQYVVDSQGFLTFMIMPEGEVSVRFTELYPAYQCSINNSTWSPVVMLDPVRPHPDDETNFTPVDVVGNRFPLTDEQGMPTGLSIAMVGRPVSDYLLFVSTPALPNYGASAILEIELERAGYLNGLQLAPFTTWPMTLTTVEGEDFSANTKQTLWSGNASIEQPMVIRFPRRIVRRIYLTFSQENYSLKEHTVDTGDNLRRDILANLQSVLPLSVRRVTKAKPNRYRGAQYEFGLENILGLDTVENPTVFVAGPFRIDGCPEVVHLDADIKGSINTYLCFRAYDAGNNEVDVQLQGFALTPGATIVFPFAGGLDRTTVSYIKAYLKVVPRTALSSLKRVQLQVTTV